MGETFYYSVMSIRSYSRPVENESLFSEALQTSTSEVSSTQVCVARELNTLMQQKETKKKRQVVPQDMKREVGLMPTNTGYQQLVRASDQPLTATRVINSKGKSFVIDAICIALNT